MGFRGCSRLIEPLSGICCLGLALSNQTYVAPSGLPVIKRTLPGATCPKERALRPLAILFRAFSALLERWIQWSLLLCRSLSRSRLGPKRINDQNGQ
jgi:hypothetical protein